jgi:AP-1 complex subunit mu
MQIDFGISSIIIKESNNNKSPIRVKFEIPYFTISGIQVRYLKVVDSSGYKALPWVRYSTQNGDYQIRQ